MLLANEVAKEHGRIEIKMHTPVAQDYCFDSCKRSANSRDAWVVAVAIGAGNIRLLI